MAVLRCTHSSIVTAFILSALMGPLLLTGCERKETVLVPVPGPAGAPGQAGAQGKQGYTGNTGDTGATGDAGVKGNQGDTVIVVPKQP